MSYISHVDYKKMMDGFKKGTPKQMLNEELEQEGNAFTAGLAKAKKGQEFKVDGKSVKDTSNYDSSIEEEMHSFDGIKKDTSHAHKLKVNAPNFTGTIFKNEDGTYVFYDVDNHNADPSLPPFKTITDLMKHFGIKMQDLHEDLEEYQFDDMYPEDPGPFEEGKDVCPGCGMPADKCTCGQEMDESGHGDEPFDFEKHAIESASGDKISRTEKDDYGRTIYWGTKDTNVSYFITDDGRIIKTDWTNGGTIKPIGDLNQYDEPTHDYEPDTDVDYEEPGEDFDMAEVKKMQGIAGIKEGLANPTKSYHGSTANQGDTGWTIDFTVIENTPEYFKIDYVMTPNSGNAPRGASRNYRPEKKYGEWKISKVGDKGQPLTDYEKSQLNIKGDRFSVNGKEFVQDIYGNEGTVGEGFNPDESDFEQAVAEQLRYLSDDKMTDKEYEQALKLLEDPKIVSKLWDLHPQKAAMVLAKMVRGKGVEEGLHMPPLQATGPTVDVNEDQAPFGMSVLSPDERKQLKEYINSYKTIKSEITKLLEKAGKPGKIMENAKKAEDETVPAERKAKYKDPTTVPTHHKHSNLGGNRTGLVMTKAEMWENEEHEEGAHERIEGMLDTKLHDAFHKVTGMIMKDLMADGFDEGDIKNFLQHEIDEKAKEAINAQHDF